MNDGSYNPSTSNPIYATCAYGDNIKIQRIVREGIRNTTDFKIEFIMNNEWGEEFQGRVIEEEVAITLPKWLKRKNWFEYECVITFYIVYTSACFFRWEWAKKCHRSNERWVDDNVIPVHQYEEVDSNMIAVQRGLEQWIAWTLQNRWVRTTG